VRVVPAPHVLEAQATDVTGVSKSSTRKGVLDIKPLVVLCFRTYALDIGFQLIDGTVTGQ
jgi:hypothetical protein